MSGAHAASTARAIASVCAVTAALAACTDATDERTAPTTALAATTTFVTLPPVGVFTYPTDAAVPIVQISADDGGALPVPLLTLYGDRSAVAAVDGAWLAGTATELDVQKFFEGAEGVGLLDDDLVLRRVGDDGIPDIAVELDVSGRRFRHELDLARIERPIALRAFLQRAVGGNLFALTVPYEAPTWLTCDEETCVASAEPADDTSRPVLRHEDVGALTSGDGAGGP